MKLYTCTGAATANEALPRGTSRARQSVCSTSSSTGAHKPEFVRMAARSPSARARRLGPGLCAVRARRVSGKGLPPVRGIIPRGWNRTHVKRALREQTLSSCGMLQLRAVLVREVSCERAPPRQRRRPEPWPQHLCVRDARRRLGGARASERARGGASGGVDKCADRVASRGGVRAEGLDRARHSADRRARQRTGARV